MGIERGSSPVGGALPVNARSGAVEVVSVAVVWHIGQEGERVMERRVLLRLLAVCGLSACGRASAGGTSLTDPATTPSLAHPRGTYLGPLTQPIDYHEAGVLLEPPGRIRPAVTPQGVDDRLASGEVGGPVGRAANICLALATTSGAGTIQPDGSIKPLLAKTLVYALTWTDVPCASSGPVRATPTTRRIESCTVVSLLDAETGAFAYGFSGSAL